ncbi:hypothetical protein [Amycolatopsis sp. lyj-112]|uniref:hypothetical protein n=1 Tax=Amycolatopsis sp. lyj-112 TaxID=2789288 RepID=UPI00397A02BD
MVLLLALAGCATTVTGTARPEPAGPPSNAALVDPARTASLLTSVRTAAEAVFSYDGANLPVHEKAATDNLTPAAREEIARLLTAVRNSPEPIKLVTKVIVSAAVEQTPDKAQVLTVVDQSSTRAGTTSKGVATVLLATIRDGERWRIAEIKVNPPRPRLPAEKPGAGERAIAVARDATRDGALRLAGTLLTVDPADLEGSYARYEAASTGELLTQFQQNKATWMTQFRASGAKTSMDPSSIAAVMELVGDRASVLLYATSNVSDAQGAVTKKPLNIVLRMQRLPEGWKASGIETVNALP